MQETPQGVAHRKEGIAMTEKGHWAKSEELLENYVLDRIDALLFAAPLLWYYWLWTAR